jgi:phage terminase small subunit
MSNITKRPLTDLQNKFVQILVESDGQLSKTECAKLAGYDDKSAYQRAYELTHPKHCPNVVQEIGRYKAEYMEKYKITPENHIQMLAKIRDQALAEKMYGVAGRMEELRGKATGLYVEKTMNLNKNEYDNLSEDELDQRMRQILEDHKDIMNAEEDKSNE